MILPAAPEVLDSLAQESLDAEIEKLPNSAGVFLVWPHEGAPYLGKTALLRRRLKRLLGRAGASSRFLNVRAAAKRVEYWPVSSQLEGSLVQYQLARQYLPETYIKYLKLRMPAYVKLVLSDRFPKIQTTTRLTSGPALYYGPFQTPAAAEHFTHECLGLFQMRRCHEELVPSPEHPGCVYGEMNMCLRPCQAVVGEQEYASEVSRVQEFLSGGGKQLLRTAEAARSRSSDSLDFEEAARQHKRVERIEEILKIRDALASDIERLCGVAVTPGHGADSVLLWFMAAGAWQTPMVFSIGASQSVSMDRRLRDAIGAMQFEGTSVAVRQEHLALLVRWFHSSWRDGAWIQFGSLREVPYRRVIAAISKTVERATKM